MDLKQQEAGHVTKHTDSPTVTSWLPSDDSERVGTNLRASGCLQFMMRLTKGPGLRIPLADRRLPNERPTTQLGQVCKQKSPRRQKFHRLQLPLCQLQTEEVAWGAETEAMTDELNEGFYIHNSSAQSKVRVHSPSMAAATPAITACVTYGLHVK